MTTQTIQTSQHTHKCAQAPVQLLPRRRPRGQGALPTRHLLLADLQRLAHLAARIAQLATKLLLQSADRVGACAHSIGLGCSSLEACRDKGGLVRGEGVGVGVLSAPRVGTSTAVGPQPALRCAGFMLKISNFLSSPERHRVTDSS